MRKIPKGFSRWDVAEHLKTDEDVQNYLDACFVEDPGDGSLIRAALGDIARARGMAQLARDTGLAREGLYKALSAEGNPEFSTVMRVINALGLKLIVECQQPPDDENPEWTEDDFAKARPAREVLPQIFGEKTAKKMLKPRGRPRLSFPK